ncbi:CoA transferase [Streptomyces sp. NPDC021212]|uniref:CoA transferase n=1 Tax=Streptomyces sp. NPDC021212 TaxID=3365118 RepID=UPI0037A8F70D
MSITGPPPSWNRKRGSGCHVSALLCRMNAEAPTGVPVDGALAGWARAMPADAAAELLQERGVPAGVVQDGRELVEHDPKLRARGFYVRAEHPVAGAFLHEGLPIHLTRTPGSLRRPAPVLGADTDTVLREVAGLTPERIERLRDAGVLR